MNVEQIEEELRQRLFKCIDDLTQAVRTQSETDAELEGLKTLNLCLTQSFPIKLMFLCLRAELA